MSTTAAHPSREVHERSHTTTLRTSAGLTALVGGAVALALGRVMSTPGGSTAERLTQMSGNDARVTASALLAILGFAGLVPGFLTVTGLVRRRGAAVATVGAALVVLGGIGFAVLASIDLATLAATHVDDTGAMRAYLHQLDVSPGIIAVTVPAALGYFVGPFLVTLGARRAGYVPRWLPWAVLVSLFLQPVGAGIGGPGAARVLDSVLQLGLVVTTAVLARAMLSASASPSS
jgi:hypothetical protein